MTTETAEVESKSAAPDYTWPFGEQHKLSRRILISVLLFIVIVPVLWIRLNEEVLTVAWHLRHGNSFVYEGVVYRIPMTQYVRCWAPLRILGQTAKGCTVMPGSRILRRITHRPTLWIAFRKDENINRNPKRMQLLGWTLLSERTINMAGNEMRCEEYLQPNKTLRTIKCYGDPTPIVITSIGTSDGSSELYDLLATAKRN